MGGTMQDIDTIIMFGVIWNALIQTIWFTLWFLDRMEA